MSRPYSVIKDQYGVKPPDNPRRRLPSGLVFVVLVLAGLFVYESVRPVVRLRPDPPPVVMGAKLNADGSAGGSQERMARACWDYALQHLEDSYPFGQPLPESPTLELRKAPKIRVLCWPRLRQAWSEDSSWVRSYQWSTDWLVDSHSSFRTKVKSFMEKLGVSTRALN